MKNVTKRFTRVLLALALIMALLPLMSKETDAASTQTISIPADSGSTTISINANETYSIVQQGGWLSVSRPSASTLRVNYTYSLSNINRIAYVYIYKGSQLVRTYKFVQDPAYIRMTLTNSWTQGTKKVYMYSIQTHLPGQLFANSSNLGYVTPTVNGRTLIVTVDTSYPYPWQTATVYVKSPNYNVTGCIYNISYR